MLLIQGLDSSLAQLSALQPFFEELNSDYFRFRRLSCLIANIRHLSSARPAVTDHSTNKQAWLCSSKILPMDSNPNFIQFPSIMKHCCCEFSPQSFENTNTFLVQGCTKAAGRSDLVNGSRFANLWSTGPFVFHIHISSCHIYVFFFQTQILTMFVCF